MDEIHKIYILLSLLIAQPPSRISQIFAAPIRNSVRLLLLFLRRVCGLESCFAEVLNSFSRSLLARLTFAHCFVRIFWVVFAGLSTWDSNFCTALFFLKSSFSFFADVHDFSSRRIVSFEFVYF